MKRARRSPSSRASSNPRRTATTASISGSRCASSSRGSSTTPKRHRRTGAHVHSPRCVALHDGSFRCSFRAAPGRDLPGGKLRIMGSANGRDWDVVHPGLTHELDGIEGDMYAGYLAELTPGELTGSFVWVDRSNPELSFVNPETAGVLEMRNLLATSRDGGATWNDWRELDLGPEQGCSCTGPSLRDRTRRAGVSLRNLEVVRRSIAWIAHRVAATFARRWRDLGRAPHRRRRSGRAHLLLGSAHGRAPGNRRARRHVLDARPSRSAPTSTTTSPGQIGAESTWSWPESTGWSGQHCQPLALGGSRLGCDSHRTDSARRDHRSPERRLRPHLDRRRTIADLRARRPAKRRLRRRSRNSGSR